MFFAIVYYIHSFYFGDFPALPGTKYCTRTGIKRHACFDGPVAYRFVALLSH